MSAFCTLCPKAATLLSTPVPPVSSAKLKHFSSRKPESQSTWLLPQPLTSTEDLKQAAQSAAKCHDYQHD